MTTLHLIDPSTSDDALDMLAALPAAVAGTHHILALGHESIRTAAVQAGIPREQISFGRSLGWADPVGWRAVSQEVARLRPDCLHAWGISGLMAGTLVRHFSGPRLLTLAHTPSSGELRLMRLLAQRVPWALAASSSSILRATLTAGWPISRAVRIRPGIALGKLQGTGPRDGIRKSCGIKPADTPVLLLAGPAKRASRHDHGLWAAGILHQIYPQAKILWREPTLLEQRRERGRGVQDFLPALPEKNMMRPVPPLTPWSTLVQTADVLLVTADQPIPVGSILWAMAAGVPVVGTALECVAELVEHLATGLLAPARRGHQHGGPKALAAKLEELLSNENLRWHLADQARAQIFTHYKPVDFNARYAAWYDIMQQDPTGESCEKLAAIVSRDPGDRAV
ncbi:MAG: glycosyltransferase family 4 protein [Phycisphaerae bacterium]